MRHPKHIRINLFKMTQQDLARELSRSQASVSEWEARGAFPTAVLSELRSLGRKKFSEGWSDSFLFDESNSTNEVA